MTEQEVALITGTRKGIGRYLAEHFVGRGYHVVGCSRSEADWELDGYEHHCVDVTEEKQVKSLISSIKKTYGRLDILVNNAGIAAMNHSMLTPTGTVDQIMATNFRGTFLFSREAAKLMRRRGYGRIINVSTIAVPMRLEGEAIYAASKSAVVTFSQILGRELAEFGITCNVVAPTPIETDLIRSIPKEKIDDIIDRLAIKRLGTFQDVANVVDFFAKPESDYITGQVITLGGI